MTDKQLNMDKRDDDSIRYLNRDKKRGRNVYGNLALRRFKRICLLLL